MITGDPRIRVRVWVDTQLVDEVWFDMGNPEVVEHVDLAKARHMAITGNAETAGQPWLIEMYDPARPEHTAYVRYGTDSAGMVDPQPGKPGE